VKNYIIFGSVTAFYILFADRLVDELKTVSLSLDIAGVQITQA